MDPDQTASIRAVLSGSTLFVVNASTKFQQLIFVVIGALRIKLDCPPDVKMNFLHWDKIYKV